MESSTSQTQTQGLSTETPVVPQFDMDAIRASRLERLRELMATRGYDAVVLRNNADLRWLTAAERVFDDEDAHTAFITQDGLYLHTDSRYYGAFLDRLGEKSAWHFDDKRISHTNWAASCVTKSRARVVAVEDTQTLSFFDGFKQALASRSVEVLLPRLHNDICKLRIVKDQSELFCLRRAQEITDAGFEHICSFIKPGQTEQEIRAELEGYMLSHGATALGFPSIVAAGPNGANPHAQPGPDRVKEGDLIVIDFGASYNDYRADMTRTVALGEPSAEQKEVYAIVKEAHETCASAVRAGVNGKEIHELAQKVISDAGYGDCFGHGLGHGVGIDIHELPCLSPSWNAPVPAGSVVTVEPGIYLRGRFGIRLEDTGLVHEDRYETFMKASHDLRVIPVA